MNRTVEVGDWIWVKHWRGPFVKVRHITSSRFYIEYHNKNAFVDRDCLVGVAESEELLSEARKAFLEMQKERESGLNACIDMVRAARAAQDDYEHETRRLADAAAKHVLEPAHAPS